MAALRMAPDHELLAAAGAGQLAGDAHGVDHRAGLAGRRPDRGAAPRSRGRDNRSPRRRSRLARTSAAPGSAETGRSPATAHSAARCRKSDGPRPRSACRPAADRPAARSRRPRPGSACRPVRSSDRARGRWWRRAGRRRSPLAEPACPARPRPRMAARDRKRSVRSPHPPATSMHKMPRTNLNMTGMAYIP